MSLPQPPTAPALPRCYRHPDRETGRSCTRCGKPACSDCLVQATVGSHCLDCARAARPDVRTRATYWKAKQQALLTTVLIGVNVLVFLYTTLQDTGSLSGRGTLSRAQCGLGLNKFVLADGGICGGKLYDSGEWYRLVTAGFLHFGVIHIAFNMLLLYQLGQLLERALGPVRFGLLYAAGLLAGSAGVLVADSSGITGGASGAVFGLMAAAAVGLHRQGVNVFSTGIGTTLLLNLFLTFAIPGISVGGHLGGAVGGAICGFLMMPPRWQPYPKWVTYATPVAVLVISVVACVILVQSASVG